MEDNFDADKKRFEDFCKGLIRDNIKLSWQISSRVNYYQNKERLELAKQAGCKLIEFGVESGSTSILKFIKKDQTIEMIKRAFKNCKEEGIRSSALFMVGLPTETLDDIQQTINLVSKIPFHYTACSIYKPYPGTELYDFCIDKGLLRKLFTLEEFGDLYSYTSSELNVSDIPRKVLDNVQSYFYFRNHINDLKAVIEFRNISLLFFGIRSILVISKFKSLLNGFSSSIVNSIHPCGEL